MAHDDASDGDDKSGDGIGLCSATMLLMTIVCLNLSVVVGVHRILWLNNSPNARKANKQTNETGKESIQHLHCSTTRHEQKLSETNFPDYSLEYFSSSPPLEFTTLTQFSSQLCAPFQVVGICCVADSWVAHFPAFLIEWNYTVFNECVYVLSHHIDGHVQQFICLYMPSQGSDWGASLCCAYTLYFYPTPRSIALILDVNTWMSEWVCFLLLKWALHIYYYWCSACCNVGPIDAYRIYDVEGGHVQSYSPTWRQLISILAAHISEGHCRYVTPDTCAIVAINMCIARVLRYPFAPNHTIIYVYMSPFHVHHTHI